MFWFHVMFTGIFMLAGLAARLTNAGATELPPAPPAVAQCVTDAECGATDGSDGLPGTSTTVTEDSPGFDWRTMGNRQRGVCLDGRPHLQHHDGVVSDDHPNRTTSCSPSLPNVQHWADAERSGATVVWNGTGGYNIR